MSDQILSEMAKAYMQRGFSVIPVAGKRPTIQWKDSQNRIPTVHEMAAWFNNPSVTGIAIVTGTISNLVVLDFEAGADITRYELPLTLTSKTGGGGYHYYYRMPSHTTIGNTTRLNGDLLDIRGEGGYVVAAPSIHPSGNKYSWVSEDCEIAELPQWVVDAMTALRSNNFSKPKKNWGEIIKGVPEGQRHSTAVSLVGKLISMTPSNEWESFVWQTILMWNDGNSPPLDENELRLIFDGIAKSESKKPTTESDHPIDLVKGGLELFHDQDGIGYVATTHNGYREIYAIQSEEFSNYISRIVWQKAKTSLSKSAKENIIGTLEAEARYDCEKHELNLRTAWQGDFLWYDLGNGSAVKITRDGWEIDHNPPLLFRRFSHQQPQVEPIHGGNIEDIVSYLNISKKDYDTLKILILTYVVAVLIPDIPRPVIAVHGLPGSAKSTFFKIIKSLVDPSKLDMMMYPKNPGELVQILSHHYLLCFDNLSKLDAYQSDELCRAVTGQAFSKRKLYSNDTDVMYYFKRAIGINGINLVATRSDLLDRSLIFELEEITKDTRQDEAMFWENFEREKPKILGAIFTALSQAIKNRPSINLLKKT